MSNSPEAARLHKMISEQIMGWPHIKPTHGTCCACRVCGYAYDEVLDGVYGCACKSYTEELEHAWLLVARLKTLGFSRWKMQNIADGISVHFFKDGESTVFYDSEYTITKNNLPEAIVFAAFEALGISDEIINDFVLHTAS